MIKVYFLLGLLVFLGLSACQKDVAIAPSEPRANHIAERSATPQITLRIVGSSTLYPLTKAVAQEFTFKTGHKIILEATGSGGGHKLFCAGPGRLTPDIVNSSRPQKPSERSQCQANGVTESVEVKIGYDGVVLAHGVNPEQKMGLTGLDFKQLYLALAKDIPTDVSKNGGAICAFQPNPYRTWSDIDPSLPRSRIEVYGPPPTSGTRDTFTEIVMQEGARRIPCLAALEVANPIAFRQRAQSLRQDNHWINSGENDTSVVQMIRQSNGAIGVFGYSMLIENSDKIEALRINGIIPNFQNISSGVYPISRPLFLYLKTDKPRTHRAIKAFAREFLSPAASGPDGYLTEMGLIPLGQADLAQYLLAIDRIGSDARAS